MAWIAAGILATLLSLLCGPGLLKSAGGLLLLLFLPGFGLTALLVRKYPLKVLERCCIAVGASLAIPIVGLMIGHLFGLKFNATVFVIALGLFSTLPHAVALFPGAGMAPVPASRFTWEHLVPVVILAVAEFFRLVNLGYSEYQGDEAYHCVAKSMAVVRGDSSLLTANRRPPTQVIVPAAVYMTCRSYGETLTRAPFAVAGMCVALLVYLLGKAMFGGAAGTAAGMMCALSGYGIAFSRIVQYQMITVLFACLAVLFMWKFMETEERGTARLSLVLGFVACGLASLTHYEGFLLLPAVLFAVVYRYRLEGLRENWGGLLVALFLFLGVVMLFYLPLYLNRHAAANVDYYSKRWDKSLHFHWDILWFSGGAYSSAVMMVTLIVLGPLAILSHRWKALTLNFLWFASYFIVFVILMRKPGTHVQNAFYPWFLVCGAGFAALLAGCHRLGQRYRVAGKFCAGVTVAAAAVVAMLVTRHLHAVFLQEAPELMWSNLPSMTYGQFGFPYRRGWKTLGYLFRRGEFRGAYRSNEKHTITNYYLRQGQTLTEERTTYIVHVRHPQSRQPEKLRSPGEGYVKVAVIESPKGDPAITVYELGAPGDAQVQIYVAGQLAKEYLALDANTPEQVSEALSSAQRR